jgi:hypothetical protein
MTEDPTGDTSTGTINMEAAVDQIANELFPDRETPDEPADGPVGEATVTPAPEPTGDVTPAEPVAPTPTTYEVPKSWPKEMHEHWAGVPPKVQEYWQTREKQMLDGLDQYKGDAAYGKTLREVIAPFDPILKQFRLEPQQAVQSLMNAHVRLTQGPLESRKAAYDELGRNLGLAEPTSNGQPVDPQIQSMQQEIQSVKQSLTAREQADYHAAQERVSQEVNAFASDTKAHPYFDEVADDIVGLIKAGYSLADAYDKAVWANPVTREKELGRVKTEEAAKLKENARLDALKAKTAASSNVKSRESKRTPTEPLGTMEDTIKAELASMKSKVAH